MQLQPGSTLVALYLASGAELSERVTDAIWLDLVGLKGEARKTWRALSSERADHEPLRQLADR